MGADSIGVADPLIDPEHQDIHMSENLVFGKGIVHDRDRLYVYASLESDDENDVYRTYVLRYLEKRWGQWCLENRVCGICSHQSEQGPEILCLCVDGSVFSSTKKGIEKHLIDGSEDGPNSLRHTTAIRMIGNHMHAVGMSRMVYRRALVGNRWERCDIGTRIPRNKVGIAGFKAVDGIADNLYAVGFRGEIWHYDGTSWSAIESPTNVKLEGVRVVARNEVYICGARGTIIRSGGEGFYVIANDETDATFCRSSYLTAKCTHQRVRMEYT